MTLNDDTSHYTFETSCKQLVFFDTDIILGLHKSQITYLKRRNHRNWSNKKEELGKNVHSKNSINTVKGKLLRQNIRIEIGGEIVFTIYSANNNVMRVKTIYNVQ